MDSILPVGVDSTPCGKGGAAQDCAGVGESKTGREQTDFRESQNSGVPFLEKTLRKHSFVINLKV